MKSSSLKCSELSTLYCLTGCTAVGKTELALAWAETFGAEIVNCDSLLFYRGMDIGTAKPTPEELDRVPHHLIDICDVRSPMDVALYLKLAVDVVREIQGRGRKVLVTGGSGFYLKAFFAPVVDAVRVGAAVKAEAAAWMERGLPEAVGELRRLNPSGLNNLDVHNPRRVSKALERCLASGASLSELSKAFSENHNPLTLAEKRLCLLQRPTEELEHRIRARVALMLEAGLLEEVEGLLESGLEENGSAARSIGYRECIACLRGELPRAELAERIVINTRRLAKKQRTWFRGQLPREGQIRAVDLHASPEPDPETLFTAGD